MKHARTVSFIAGLVLFGCGRDEPTPVTTNDAGKDTGNEDATSADAGDDGSVPLATGQIDRMGRPAITTMLISPANKQPYNKSPTWGAVPTFVSAEFDGHLKYLDNLANPTDAGPDWPPNGGAHPLTRQFQPDVLIVDPNTECPDRGSYLDLELYLTGLYEGLLPDGGSPKYTTCGGRTPNDDVIDHSLSLLVVKDLRYSATLGGAADPVRDCVDAPTKPASSTWPYLQDPN